MRPLHWDKINVTLIGGIEGTIWSKIHDDSRIDTSFDFDEFESMFSQKEVVKEEKKPVSEYNPPEQFVAMVLSMGDVFKPRLAAWTFTLSWKSRMETLRGPLVRVSV